MQIYLGVIQILNTIMIRIHNLLLSSAGVQIHNDVTSPAAGATVSVSKQRAAVTGGCSKKTEDTNSFLRCCPCDVNVFSDYYFNQYDETKQQLSYNKTQ